MRVGSITWESLNRGNLGLRLSLTFSKRPFCPQHLSSSARRNDGLPAEKTRCYLLITDPHGDPCPLVIAMLDTLLEERDRQKKRDDKERMWICRNIKCQKSIINTAEQSKQNPVVSYIGLYNKYILCSMNIYSIYRKHTHTYTNTWFSKLNT